MMLDDRTTSKLVNGIREHASASAEGRPREGTEGAGSPKGRHEAEEEVLRATRPSLAPPERSRRAATVRALVEAFDMIVHYVRGTRRSPRA